jgi:hypothetical protein
MQYTHTRFAAHVEPTLAPFARRTLPQLQHRLDNAKLVRYAGFARQSLRELAYIPPDLAASVRMLQVKTLRLHGAFNVEVVLR